MFKTWVFDEKTSTKKLGLKFGLLKELRAHHYKLSVAAPITVCDGICATKIVHEALVTFEPIELQKTTTPQNDGNCLRILNFWVKNFFTLKWAGYCPIYCCPRPIVMGPAVEP